MADDGVVTSSDILNIDLDFQIVIMSIFMAIKLICYFILSLSVILFSICFLLLMYIHMIDNTNT